MNDLRHKVALITGAASGIGRQLADAAVKCGMRLVLADVQEDALEQAYSELREQTAEILAVPCDVRKESAVQALADAAMQRYGVVHVIFNNAGVGVGGLVWENSVADWEWILGVNLWGAIHGVRVFVPLMLECAKADRNYHGHIVNTASIAGMVNAPMLGAYNVTKHAVVSLSESLYHDLKLIEAPIGTSVLCPFFVPTGIGSAERNRPDDLKNCVPQTDSQKLSRSLIENALNSGHLSAEQVAQHTLDAVCRGDFYIFPHRNVLNDVHKRMEDILSSRNPRDLYETEPKFAKMLQRKIGNYSFASGSSMQDVQR